MKLYLVRGNDAGGENQDLFVVAETPDQAGQIWNGYCVKNGWDRDDDDDNTSFIEPANTREILLDVTGTQYDGQARGIDWEDLTIVQEV